MSANLIEFSENSGNLRQNVQYFSQMAALFVAFPEYLGHSNQFVTSSWGFSENSGNSTQNTYRFVAVKYFVMAFTLRDAKMLVIVKRLQERALPNEFVLKCSSFTLYIAF